MNRAQPPTTRRETTYRDVGNADIASLHGCNLLGQRRSGCRGANICHPWWLNTRIRPPRTVEVQVLHRYMDVTY